MGVCLSTEYQSNPYGGVSNPYQDLGGVSYLTMRGTKPTDFGEFRASSANDMPETAPLFTVVRFVSPSYALAGGEQGMLYRGELADNTWTWTATPDESKEFMANKVRDICVVDSDIAVACAGGSVMFTNNGGAGWSQIYSSGDVWVPQYFTVKPAEDLAQVSFYDFQHGWCVGKKCDENVAVIIKTGNGGGYWDRYSISGMTNARAVAAVDDTHVWVAGDGGLYVTSNGGTDWTQQSSCATINKMRVVKVGSDYVGWAAGSDGTILHTTDGSTWSQQSNPLGAVAATDLAMYDSARAAIAYGQAKFLVYVTDHWEKNESDLTFSKVSVAPDGAGSFLAVGQKTLRRSGSPWTNVYTIPDAHWKIRYIVCRLEGYPDDGDSDGIPDDIKRMIDDAANPTTSGPRNFVLDGNVTGGSDIQVASTNLTAVVGSNQLIADTGAAYLTQQSNVMGYWSHGRIYDNPLADMTTTYGRPFNAWCKGGVGIYATSFDGQSLRSFHSLGIKRTSSSNQHDGQSWLKITGLPAPDAVDENHDAYAGHWVGIYSTANPDVALRSAEFSMGWAELRIDNLTWPSQGSLYAEIHFPEDDLYHPNEAVPGASTRYGNQLTSGDLASGAVYTAQLGHPSIAELIREGASGAVTHVREPGGPGGFWESEEYIFPRYAAGFTWGEAAYLGMGGLGSQLVVLGDPLMAPYATAPSVSIISPDESRISGVIPIVVEAQSNPPEVGLKRVEFWLTNGSGFAKRLG
ncbi:MAG: hypothetical protein Q7T82_12480, partial [Armatimonadota bacterium]|nr:hypothetical protein [Armatimonadota bacterium]